MRAASYLFIWLPVVILGCLASFVTISLANALNLRYLPIWVVMLLNLVPAFSCGVWCYYRDARRARSRADLAAPSPGHFGRAAPLYIISGVLVAYIVANNGDREFGLVAQFVVWPLMVTVGGILGDALVGSGSVRTCSDTAV
jgi:hypothetical protein